MKQWRLFDAYEMKILHRADSREEIMEYWKELGKKVGLKKAVRLRIIRPTDETFDKTFKGIEDNP